MGCKVENCKRGALCATCYLCAYHHGDACHVVKPSRKVGRQPGSKQAAAAAAAVTPVSDRKARSGVVEAVTALQQAERSSSGSMYADADAREMFVAQAAKQHRALSAPDADMTGVLKSLGWPPAAAANLPACTDKQAKRLFSESASSRDSDDDTSHSSDDDAAHSDADTAEGFHAESTADAAALMLILLLACTTTLTYSTE
jgi:hypothetical protein